MTSSDQFLDDLDISPRAIAEHILDETRRGIMEDRFDLFLPCILIPTRIETFEASRDITSVEELLEVFQAARHYYSSLRITHFDRRCIAAEISGPGRISFTYETRLLEGPRLVQEPYPVFADAVLDAGKWKVARSSYAIVDQAHHIRVLTGES